MKKTTTFKYQGFSPGSTQNPNNHHTWFGFEVKAGATLKVQTGLQSWVHLSNVSFEKIVKHDEMVHIFLRRYDQVSVIGTLSGITQTVSCNVSLNGTFELYHDGRSGSLHVCGYELIFPGESELITVEEYVMDSSSSDYDENEEYDTDEDYKLKWPNMNVFAAPSKMDKQKLEFAKKNLKPGNKGAGSSGKKIGGQTSSPKGK
ncbi:hypothetical protein ACHQM5_014696 [Ranunculus cassubicifolius]